MLSMVHSAGGRSLDGNSKARQGYDYIRSYSQSNGWFYLQRNLGIAGYRNKQFEDGEQKELTCMLSLKSSFAEAVSFTEELTL